MTIGSLQILVHVCAPRCETLSVGSWNSALTNSPPTLDEPRTMSRLWGAQWVSSVAQPCPTLFDPMDCSRPGLPVHHQLPEFAQTHVYRVSDTIQPSHPLSSPSSAFDLFQHQGLFQWVSEGPSMCINYDIMVTWRKKIFPIFWRYMPGFTEIKNLPTMQETQVWSLGWEKIPWRRKWQPASVFLPGRVHGQRSLVGYSPWGHKESDTTEHTCWHIYRCNDILRSGWETRGQDLLQWVSHLYQVATHHPTWWGAGRPIWLLITATPEDQQGGKHTLFSAICFGPYFGSHSWPPLSSLLDFEDTDTIQTTKLFLAAFISNEGQPPGWWLRMQDVRGWDQPHRHVLKQL